LLKGRRLDRFRSFLAKKPGELGTGVSTRNVDVLAIEENDDDTKRNYEIFALFDLADCLGPVTAS
jgi:hypothetical protein